MVSDCSGTAKTVVSKLPLLLKSSILPSPGLPLSRSTALSLNAVRLSVTLFGVPPPRLIGSRPA